MTNATTIGPLTFRHLLDAGAGGRFSVVEFTIAPGCSGPPIPHAHTREEAAFIVLEGSLELTIAGETRFVSGGGIAHLPTATIFTWKNASSDTPARFLCVYSPAGFERYFADIADALDSREPGPDVMREVIPPLWRQYGVQPR